MKDSVKAFMRAAIIAIFSVSVMMLASSGKITLSAIILIVAPFVHEFAFKYVPFLQYKKRHAIQQQFPAAKVRDDGVIIVDNIVG